MCSFSWEIWYIYIWAVVGSVLAELSMMKIGKIAITHDYYLVIANWSDCACVISKVLGWMNVMVV